MEFHTWLAFLAASCLIALSPGSGAVLSMSHGLAYGVRRTGATILGLQLGLLLVLVIAGAGGAAHLPGMAAAMTPLPVFGVPVESKALSGQDSLLSIVQMPAGIPVGTLAIGRAGAVNAALLAAAVLALSDTDLAGRLDAWRARQSASVAERPDTSHDSPKA